jgi:hypothetical protein
MNLSDLVTRLYNLNVPDASEVVIDTSRVSKDATGVQIVDVTTTPVRPWHYSNESNDLVVLVLGEAR